MLTLTINSDEIGMINFKKILAIISKAKNRSIDRKSIPTKLIIETAIRNITLPTKYISNPIIRRQIIRYFVYLYAEENLTKAASINPEILGKNNSYLRNGYNAIVDILSYDNTFKQHIDKMDLIIKRKIQEYDKSKIATNSK